MESEKATKLIKKYIDSYMLDHKKTERSMMLKGYEIKQTQYEDLYMIALRKIIIESVLEDNRDFIDKINNYINSYK